MKMKNKGTKLRKSAKGQDCMVNIWGVCNNRPETVVLAHLNGGGGGMKHHDMFGAFACSACHEWLDGGYVRSTDRKERDAIHAEAIHRTQQWWLDNNFIEVKR